MLLAVLSAAWAVAAPTFVWREAESADEANFQYQLEAPAHPELISGGKWLRSSTEEQGPDKGDIDRRLLYKLTIPRADTYRFWLRLGMEFVRVPLRWRMDDGDWQTIKPSDLTCDMTELSLWTEIGWLNPGTLKLAAGAHTLELVADEPNSRDTRGLLALDALTLVAGDWTPCANLKPGEEPSEARDVKAAASVFTLPLKTDPGARAEVSLTGLWQVCRDDDPDMDADPYGPQRALPPAHRQHWRGCYIPPNPYQPLPAALEMAHRVWYRTKVFVPKEYAGRGFYLHFFGTNWIASVVVNGQFMGFTKSTRVPWDLDISAAVKPGADNEVCVGIKDWYYALDAKGRNTTLDEARNIPPGFITSFFKRFVAPIYPTTKGDADGMVSGITDWVNFVVAGRVYTENVFVQTSVARGTITVTATLRNPTATPAEVRVGAEAIFTRTGAVEKTLPAVAAVVPAGGTQAVTLTAPWADAKLWWPGEDPANIYRLRTTLSQAGAPVDIFEHEQHFGFREITVDGLYVRVNGLRFNAWNLLAGLKGSSEAELLAHFRAGNNRFERFGDDLGLRDKLGPRPYQLDWMDRHGIPGRLSTMIDGMFITYDLGNPVVWENFREHVAQVVKAYRNHPSVFCYSLENELLLINGRLGNGNIMAKVVEPEAKALQDTAHRLDPTRPCMLDGAGALKDQSMDICNTHYAEDGFFPDNARPLGDTDPNAPGVSLDPNARGTNAQGFTGLWTWDRKRPYCAGEIAYFSGNNTDHAWIGGAAACEDRTGAYAAYARYVRYIFERYRWNDVAMIFPWVGTDGMEACRPAMAPLAAFTREYNTNFTGGEAFTRTVKVFNDTFNTAPVTFTWALAADGKAVGGATQALTIEPGFGQVVTLACPLPAVTARTPAALTLTVTQPGSPTFTETKAYTLFPRAPALATKRAVFLLAPPAGFAETLRKAGVTAKPVAAVAEIPDNEAILLVPPDSALLAQAVAYANGGGRVVCLEQRAPLETAALGLPLTVAHDAAKRPVASYFNFGQGDTPLLAGLDDAALANWTGTAPTADVLWHKPVGAVRGWVVAGRNLDQCALVSAVTGKGAVVATQLRVGAGLGREPAAQVLLHNLLRWADAPRTAGKGVRIFARTATKLETLLAEQGVVFTDDRPLAEAIKDSTACPILVVEASRENLNTLNNARETLDAYLTSGGWLMLWNLEPEGLATFNTLLGTRHVMREFRAERVRLRRDPLTVGLDSADTAMLSTELLAKWMDMKRVSSDVYTFCVDANPDIAPFCFGPPNRKYNFGDTGGGATAMVNGLRNADFWKYINQFWYGGTVPEGGLPVHTFRLPAPCALERITVWNNANYDTIEKLDVQVNGATAATLTLPDSYDAAGADLRGATANTVSLLVRSARARKGNLLGIDLVTLTRATPDWLRDRVVSLDDIGGLVRYPRGKGGVVLNQLKLNMSDQAENGRKKMRLFTGLLHNLGAAFEAKAAEDDGPTAELPD
jgi:beta-galactosidase